ncbi:RHS repeat domain-containing protein [Luoshenia tenuis]|nr:RHS repeat-associated core domain-containing protein [Luoshenia tenuis]
MTWEHGRQLAGVSKSGSTLSFDYDADGVRISKTVNGVETKYYTASDQILRMEKGDDVLDFLYDEAGMVFSVIHNGTPYYYVRNGQNDIVALVDQNANIIGQYSYDAWGKPLQTTGDAKIVLLNPFRYRGYVYDQETGLYYLLSRYYDPETGRYINADGLVSTGQGIGGTNMFSYCGNNPVIRQDPSGCGFESLWAAMQKNLAGDIDIGPGYEFGGLNTSLPQRKPSSAPIANHVKKKSATMPTAMLDLGTAFGKVGFSATKTTEDKSPALLNSYENFNLTRGSGSVGVGISDWFGLGVGASPEGNVFAELQLTPWVHGGVSIGIDGIGIVAGWDDARTNTAYDLEAKAGWGLFAIACGLYSVPSGGGQPVPVYS